MTDIIANLGAARTKRPHRHEWVQNWHWHGNLEQRAGVCVTQCVRCNAIKDQAKSRRGKSSSRLGKDTERRIEKRYGPTKVGEFGDAIDLLGRDFKWQSKSTRAAMPRYLDAIETWAPIEARAWITTPMDAMAPLHADLRPLLIRSWVRQGVPARDIVIVRSADWAELHGVECMSELIAMTGEWFLDVHGRDERGGD